MSLNEPCFLEFLEDPGLYCFSVPSLPGLGGGTAYYIWSPDPELSAVGGDRHEDGSRSCQVPSSLR